MSKRLAGRCGYPADNPFKVTLHPERLEEPLRWRKPSRIFACSMGDLFHEDVEIGFLTHVFDMMEQCPHHTFLVLTKRPERIKKMMYEPHGKGWRYFGEGDCYPNVHLGVSVEDQQTADERIPLLLQTPAAKRFVSYEPALGPISFRWMNAWLENAPITAMNPDSGGATNHLDGLRRLDWVIMGGESGPGARPMHPDWARSVRDQCKEAGVPFFFKQWGEWAKDTQHGFAASGVKYHRFEDGTLVERVGKKAAGRLLDGVDHKEVAE